MFTSKFALIFPLHKTIYSFFFSPSPPVFIPSDTESTEGIRTELLSGSEIEVY